MAKIASKKTVAVATAEEVANECRANIAQALTPVTAVIQYDDSEEPKTSEEPKEPKAAEKKDVRRANCLSSFCYDLLEKGSLTDKEIATELVMAYPDYKGTDTRTVKYYRDRLNLKRMKLNMSKIEEVGGSPKSTKSAAKKAEVIDPMEFLASTAV